jgi:hypothetical protein
LTLPQGAAIPAAMKRRFFLFAAPLALTACGDWTKPMSAEDAAWWDRYERRAEVRRLVREIESERRARRRRR